MISPNEYRRHKRGALKGAAWWKVARPKAVVRRERNIYNVKRRYLRGVLPGTIVAGAAARNGSALKLLSN